MSDISTALYLDLMKRVLTDSIFLDDPLAHVVPYRLKPTTSAVKRMAMTMLGEVLSGYRISMVEANDTFTDEERQEAVLNGKVWPARAHSMIGMKRLNNLQFCVESVLQNNVPGDLIETGVWRGGACILMRAILKAYGVNDRKVWVADSFQGLPPPSDQYEADAGDDHHTHDVLAVSVGEVRENFARYNLLDKNVGFLQGWFKDTLPFAPIERLAVLRLDGDMYESTIQALDALYAKLSSGGFVIVDDYNLEPCRKAIHDFRETHHITDPIINIDGSGAYWQHK